MKKILLLILSSFCLFLNCSLADEQEKPKPEIKTETITKDGYTLVVNVEDPQFPDAVKKKMINAFFKVYPKLSGDFNPKSAKSVTFIIKEMDGVAYSAGGKIVFSSNWMKNSQGNDIDVVTHEAMHIVQAYRSGGPGWITEGIADFVRYKYGIDNKGSGWALPGFSENQKYTDSYRVTARFFAWLETNVKKSVITDLDAVMRDGKYTPDTWKDLTGKTVDELWEMYAKDPKLPKQK